MMNLRQNRRGSGIEPSSQVQGSNFVAKEPKHAVLHVVEGAK